MYRIKKRKAFCSIWGFERVGIWGFKEVVTVSDNNVKNSNSFKTPYSKERSFRCKFLLALTTHKWVVPKFEAMYTKEQASQLRQAFWTAFGQYMTPVLSADGEKVAWLNYKTGEKGIYFKMQADNKKASIGIELTHSDAGIQQLYFEQWEQLKTLLHHTLQEEWTWKLHTHDENGKLVSRIYKELPAVSIFKKEDWPSLISFFKPRIIALDEFWSTAKYTFETLR